MLVRSQIPSLIDASPEQRLQLLKLTEQEREWYADYPRFATNDDIVEAASKWRSSLKFINPDSNVVPIGRLRNPELREAFPPYLLKPAAVALKAIGRAWRQELGKAGLNLPKVKLAVTSLARSQEMQERILADPSKLAVPDSTHTAAAAFDIDASGYYIADRSGLVPVTHPQRDKFKEAIATGRLRGLVRSPYLNPISRETFNPGVIDALARVADHMHELGLINRVLEYEGTPNQCLHIAPNPNAADFLR